MNVFTAIAYGCFFTLSATLASAQNNALNFDGIDDYIKVPYSPSHDMTNAVTIEAWVYPTNDNWDNILMKGNYGYGFALSGYGGAGSCGNNGELVFWDQSQCGSTIRSSLNYVQNTWQHVAVTVEDIGSQLRIYFYLDGVQDGPFLSGATNIDNGGIDNNIYIGTQGLGLGNFFEGNMDELRVWNEIRTQIGIQSAMHDQLDPAAQSSLVAYYTFNQGVGGADNTGIITALDSTANANNGTLLNFELNGNTSNWVGSPVVLPVRLVSFNAVHKAGSIDLSWSTVQEQNSNSFEIERSGSGANFIRIGTVAAGGNSNDRIDYHFTDASPLNGNNYYRLKQTDADEKYTYSPIVKLNFSAATYIRIQGNPVQTHLKAVFSGTTKGDLQLVVTDASGAALIDRTIAVQAGANEITIPLGDIKSGIYFLQAWCGNWKQVLKFSRR